LIKDRLLKHIIEDKSGWPVVTYRFKGHQTSEDIDGLLESWQENVDRKDEFFLIFHMSNYDPHIGHVKRLAGWLLRHQKETRAYCLGVAIIAPRLGVIKMVLNAFLLISPFPFPYKLFTQEEEAGTWIQEHLKHRKETTL
jgi:hypothetical protein